MIHFLLCLAASSRSPCNDFFFRFLLFNFLHHAQPLSQYLPDPFLDGHMVHHLFAHPRLFASREENQTKMQYSYQSEARDAYQRQVNALNTRATRAFERSRGQVDDYRSGKNQGLGTSRDQGGGASYRSGSNRGRRSYRGRRRAGAPPPRGPGQNPAAGRLVERHPEGREQEPHPHPA